MGLVVCLAVTAAIYTPHVVTASFVYEDNNDINTTYRPWQSVVTELHDAAVRPARALTRTVQRLVGFDAVRQHLGSLVLHLAAGVLVYLVALSVLAPWPSVLAAGLFLLAPWQTAAVAYAAARSDILMTLAVLVGLWAVTRGRLALATLAAVAAVAAKEYGIVAWLLLPAWAIWRRSPWPISAVFGWALAGCGGVALAFGARDPGAPIFLPSLWTNLRAFVGLFAWPTVDPMPAGALAVWTVLAAVGVAAWRLPRWTTLVVGGVALAWLPRLLVPLAEGPHTQHLYLPMVALSLGAARLLTKETVWPKD
jgi:hypothetical protein